MSMSCRQSAECERCHPRWGSCDLFSGHGGSHWTRTCGQKRTAEQGPEYPSYLKCYCDEEDES